MLGFLGGEGLFLEGGREEKGRIGVLYRLKPETRSCNFLKLVLENRGLESSTGLSVIYKELVLPQVGASKKGNWCLLELVLKRREIVVSYKL